MPKTKTTLPDEIANHKARLEQISGVNFGALSDDEALELLAERKHIQGLYEEYQKRQAHLTELIAEEDQTEDAITALNQSISPDKDDAALLSLIAHRKELEEKLLSVHGEIEALKRGKREKTQSEKEPAPAPVSESEALNTETASEAAEEVSAAQTETEEALEPASTEETPKTDPVAEASPYALEPIGKEEASPAVEPAPGETAPAEPEVSSASSVGMTEEFGTEGIAESSLGKNVDLERYLDQLKSNKDSLGTLLQGMPLNAKKNKAFMLEVAHIDPAYAMHYADMTLKKDEDFNVQVAGIKNPRNSGNALSEMLPEARTAKVVSAGVKQDYKNIRFAAPQMEGYADMLASAKKRALEEIRQMKNAVDVRLLVPKPLQQDKAFMQEVEKARTEGQAS